MMDDDVAPLPPEIPDYRIFAYCGKGGGGTVWAAWDPAGNLRAVKVIMVDPEEEPERFSAGLRAVSAFAAASRECRYLMKVYHIGTGNGFWYYVMDLADNRFPGNLPGCYEPDSLEKRLNHGELNREATLKIMRNLLDGARALHKAQFAHCDLKPDNIVFVRGEVRICDPGLVRPGSQKNDSGTEDYHPNGGHNAFECDIYAMGKILYRLYSGRPVEDFPALPPESRFSRLRFINKLALRCCAGDPCKMFHSVDALAHAVERALPKPLQQQTASAHPHHFRGILWALGMFFVFLSLFFLLLTAGFSLEK